MLQGIQCNDQTEQQNSQEMSKWEKKITIFDYFPKEIDTTRPIWL